MKFDDLMGIRKGVCMLSCFSSVQLFVTPWTCLLQGIFPTQGLNLCLLCSLHSETMSSVKFSCSVVFDYLWPHGLHHSTRPPCPSPTIGVYSNSWPLSQWCHPAISSSVVPFSSALNLSQHPGLFKWVRSSHQMAKVLAFQLQHQSFQWTLRTDLL